MSFQYQILTRHPQSQRLSAFGEQSVDSHSSISCPELRQGFDHPRTTHHPPEPDFQKEKVEGKHLYAFTLICNSTSDGYIGRKQKSNYSSNAIEYLPKPLQVDA